MNTFTRIASWNIAGARKMKSFERFDYTGEDIEYFVSCLRGLDPDIVCLQETHTNGVRSIASEIANSLALPHIYEAVVSDSHIDGSFRLGNAILSKYPLVHIADKYYPYPDFDLYFKDGSPAVCHEKMVQIYTLNDLTIANTQMLPLGVFSKSYTEGDGRKLAEEIDETLSQNLSSPLVFCGDFNFNNPKDIYPITYKKFQLAEALPNKLTRPNEKGVKLTPDHILISDGIKLLDADVMEVMADHYLCYADIRK